jgi:hypothetical protein
MQQILIELALALELLSSLIAAQTALASSTPAVGTSTAIVASTTIPPTIPGAPDPKEVWIDALAECENRQWPELRRIVDVNGYYSYGPLMFQQATWLSYGAPFGATAENVYDEALQKTVTSAMLDDGGWRHWYHCAIQIETKLGSYPDST